MIKNWTREGLGTRLHYTSAVRAKISIGSSRTKGMPGPADAYGLKLISVTAVTKQRHSACESTDKKEELKTERLKIRLGS